MCKMFFLFHNMHHLHVTVWQYIFTCCCMLPDLCIFCVLCIAYITCLPCSITYLMSSLEWQTVSLYVDKYVECIAADLYTVSGYSPGMAAVTLRGAVQENTLQM